MPALADLLADLADEAHRYGDAAAAVRTARGRRRRRDLLAATGASATGLLLVLAGLLGPTALNIRPGAGPSAGSLAFPTGPVPLLADAPPMTPGQPVGQASFLRMRTGPAGVQIYVVLPDGRQYRIDQPHTPEQKQSITLSPNGRYVVWTAPDGPVLRDLLTGDDVPVAAPDQFLEWSPDSFWLLGTDALNGQVVTNLLGRRSYVVGPSERDPLDVLNDGRLLVLAGYRLDGQIPMMVSDPVDGGIPRAFTVDAAPYLSPGQTVAVHSPQLSRIPHWVGGGAYGHAVMAINCADTGPNCGLLVFSPVDGKVQRRIDLPGRWPRSIVGWSADGVERDRVLLTEARIGGTTLLAVDPATGGVQEVSGLKPGADGEWGELVVRGGVATWG
jgi:hypothetical protein